MTENEAIERLKCMRLFMQINDKASESKFLEEDYIANKMAIKALEEIQRYQEIGTVEECREAKERQMAEKPILCMNEVSGMFVDYADGHGEYKTQMNNWWRCPCCNEVVGQRVIAHNHIHDQRKKKFCEKCGQAISWESDTP